MPSFTHEFLVDLFRNCHALAPSLLGTCAKIDLDHARVQDRSIDLTQVTSTEYRADVVVILEDRKGRPVAGLIIEVQIDDDEEKRFSWPGYVATLRKKYRCPTLLLVLAPNRAVARWARKPIEIGHPGFRLAPIVIGFGDVPRIQNESDAARMPELAVLSTLAHPELEIARATIIGIKDLPLERKELYMDVIMSVLPATVRRGLEVEMQSYKDTYRSDWVHGFVMRGREEGIAKGREEGIAKGREEGIAKGREEGIAKGREEGVVTGRKEGRGQGRREVVRMVARSKLKRLTDDEVAAIDLVDHRRLGALVTSLSKARTTAEARLVLKRVRTQTT